MTPKQFVLEQFPGRIAITLVEAGKAIGYLAPQTCYNMHSKGTFPLKVHKEGKRPMVALTELIRYLESKTGPAANDPGLVQQTPRRRGRPSARYREMIG